MKPSSFSGRQGRQAGSVLIMVAVAFVALFSFAVLAIDGPILMTTKTQLQNAADAAALAGASGLLQGGQDVALQRAIDFASFNFAVQDTLSPVIITSDDITFPEAMQISVRTHRTDATGDPLRTYFRRIVDWAAPNTTDVVARATAEAFDVCGTRCVKPWSIPDRWDDTDGDGRFDAGEPYHPDSTGYVVPDDVGRQIILKVGNPSGTIEPGIFFPVCYPPIGREEAPRTGASWYEEFIAGCEPFLVGPGDSLLVEPGAVVGPTSHGIDDLIAQDPGAYWDATTGAVRGSRYGMSPRVALVPFFDPTQPPIPGRSQVVVVKLGAFFIEAMGPSGNVTGRFMQVMAPGEPCPGGGGPGSTSPSFIRGIALIQ